MELEKLEAFVLEKMSKTKMPGLSLAVLKDDEVVYARGFGFRDVENGLRATPHTLYGIGSVTKSFTALAIMQLVERGLVSLGDPVEKYVPLKIKPFGEPIRVEHLLTHSSGIPALGYAEALIRSVVGDDTTWIPIASPDDVLTFMAKAEDWVEAKPGEKFYYLNEGYVLLGRIVEKASGKKYEEYVKENILKPLDMNRSVFTREELEKDADKAVPYVITKEGSRMRSTYPFGITADGGLISNVIDLTKYLRMYVNRGEVDGVRVASKESIEEMEKPRIRVPYEVFGGESYGYGWMVTPSFLGRKLVGHGGSVLVSTAYVGYLPEEKLGVAVLANASGYPLSMIGIYALALMLGKDPEELEIVKRDRILDKLAGKYETYMGTFKATVNRSGDFLFLDTRGKYTGYVIPLVPEELSEEKATFFTVSAGRKVRAEFRIRDGSRVELIFERYKFRKVE